MSLEKFNWRELIDVDLPRCADAYYWDNTLGKYIGDNDRYILRNKIILERHLP